MQTEAQDDGVVIIASSNMRWLIVTSDDRARSNKVLREAKDNDLALGGKMSSLRIFVVNEEPGRR